MGPGTNYDIIVSDGGIRNRYMQDETFYLQKGDVLKYEGAQKNGFIKVLYNYEIPCFTGPNYETNVGWVSAKYLKRVTTCTACKGTGRKGTCPTCKGVGWGNCCYYTGMGVCRTCSGKGYR